jgi:hypothetical protein
MSRGGAPSSDISSEAGDGFQSSVLGELLDQAFAGLTSSASGSSRSLVFSQFGLLRIEVEAQKSIAQ